jgi:NAD(P)-dependent dehydrogenase (short-subunit alcohol dehydrogenase family)
MAYELAPQGIDVVLVKPGPARTPIWESLGTAQERLAQVITTPDMAQLYEADFAAVRLGHLRSVMPVDHLHHQSLTALTLSTISQQH